MTSQYRKKHTFSDRVVVAVCKDFIFASVVYFHDFYGGLSQMLKAGGFRCKEIFVCFEFSLNSEKNQKLSIPRVIMHQSVAMQTAWMKSAPP